MAVVTATLAAIGVATAVAGTAYSISQGQKAAGLQAQQANNQFQVGQLQAVGAGIQNQASQNSTIAQTALLKIQQQQADLSTDTNKSVIGQQRGLEALKRQGNTLNQTFNNTSRQAAVRLEGLNQQNDVLNQQGDLIDTQSENLQRSLAYLTERRAQRDAVRQGVVANASALAHGVASGTIDSSTTQGNRQNVQGQVATAVQTAGENRQGQLTQIQLASDKRQLGIQSRDLGVAARGENYNLALGRYDLQDNQFAVNDKQFDINDNISNIYLGAQDQNAALVGGANSINQHLLQSNQGYQNDLLGIQKQIYQLGGQNNLLSAQASAAQGASQMGVGLASMGNSFVSNAQTLGKIYDTYSPGSFADASNWNTSLPSNGFKWG